MEFQRSQIIYKIQQLPQKSISDPAPGVLEVLLPRDVTGISTGPSPERQGFAVLLQLTPSCWVLWGFFIFYNHHCSSIHPVDTGVCSYTYLFIYS